MFQRFSFKFIQKLQVQAVRSVPSKLSLIRPQSRFFSLDADVKAQDLDRVAVYEQALDRAVEDPDVPPVQIAEGATTDPGSEPLEARDAEEVFRSVWNKLIQKYGETNLVFPRDILLLCGAPGAGKGHMTPFIMAQRGITAQPIEVGALLSSPEALAIKAQGKLVDDRMVIELLLERLLCKEYETGVIVDGFPRTVVQAECLKLLYSHMMALKRKYEGSEEGARFRRPIFHIMVLFINQEQSVTRQLARGLKAQQHNEIVSATGVGRTEIIRETDVDPTLAKERYRQFKEQVYGSLQVIKEKFHFHFVNADGPIKDVQRRILQELRYQSAMELDDDTYDKIRTIPTASEIVQNARHKLVNRLESYQHGQADLFKKVVGIVKQEFMPIISRQALSGRAIIRSENPVFVSHPQCIDMALDLLTERGFIVVLDLRKEPQPDCVIDGKIVFKERKVFEFQIEFERPAIRRGQY